MVSFLNVDRFLKIILMSIPVEDDDEETETFQRVLQQQREMQVKRAKEAEAKKNKSST